MKDHPLPKIVLFCELWHWPLRQRGTEEECKEVPDAFHIDHCQRSFLATDLKALRQTIHQALSSFENTRGASLKDKKEGGRTWRLDSTILRPDLHLRMQPSAPHWPRQPRAYLQSTWTFSFIDLRSQSQDMMTDDITRQRHI